MKKEILILLLVIISVSGCQRFNPRLGPKPHQFNVISEGLSETEVTEILGIPYSTSVKGHNKLLHYKSRGISRSGIKTIENYGVLFEDGKVSAFGINLHLHNIH